MDSDTARSSSPSRLRLEGLLKAARRRIIVFSVSSGVLLALTILGAVALAVFGADRLTLFPRGLRLAVTSAFVIGATALVYMRVVIPLIRRPDARAAAMALERRFPVFGDFALSAAELAIVRKGSSAPSAELVDMTIDEAVKRAADVDPTDAVPLGRLARLSAMAGAAVAAWLVVAALFPLDAATFVRRFADPLSTISYPARTRIVSVTAPGVIPSGAQFHAEAILAGVLPNEAEFHVKPGSASGRVVYAAGRDGRYSLDLDRVREDFSFYVAAGGTASSEYQVSVVERPAVAKLSADVEYPSYTGMGTITVSGGNVKALQGSHARLVAAFSKPVASARLSFADGADVAGTLSADKRSATFLFDVTESRTYRIALLDEHGFDAEDAPTYSVIPEADAPPVVSLNRPTRDLTVVADATLPLEITVSDDYGVTAIALHYTVSGEGAQAEERSVIIAEEAPPTRSTNASLKWSLAALAVEPGDEIAYYVEAADNLPGAPQAGRSELRKAAVVTVAAKLAEIEQITRQLQVNLQAMARKQQEARAAVEAAGEGVPQ